MKVVYGLHYGQIAIVPTLVGSTCAGVPTLVGSVQGCVIARSLAKAGTPTLTIGDKKPGQRITLPRSQIKTIKLTESSYSNVTGNPSLRTPIL